METLDPAISGDRSWTSLGRIWLLAAVVGLCIPGFAWPSAWAADQGIGGSGSLFNQTVDVPQGREIPPINFLTVHNPNDDRSIDVSIEIEVDNQVSIDMETTEFSLKPSATRQVPFSIAASQSAAPGEYPVVMKAVRADIKAASEEGVKFVPALQMNFTVNVVGEAGEVRVQAIDARSGDRVSGEFRLGRVSPNDNIQAVEQTQGAELRATVAPARYETAFYLQGEELGKARVTVEADKLAEVTLEVNAIHFVNVAAQPQYSGDDVVSAELAGAVMNRLNPFPDTSIDVTVYHNDAELETVSVEQFAKVRTGLTNFTEAYRPARGWESGTYRFRFTFTSGDTVFSSLEEPQFEIPGGIPWFLILIVAGVLLLVVGLVVWWRRRRRNDREVAPPPPLASMPPPTGPRY